MDRGLHLANDEVLLLGSMVEQDMLNAIDTLKRRNKKAARQIYNDDKLINEKRFAVDNRVLILFATQQPIARGL